MLHCGAWQGGAVPCKQGQLFLSVMVFSRQDLSKHKTDVVNLLAMVDTYNCLINGDPSIPKLTHPASNNSIQSVLHNNR